MVVAVVVVVVVEEAESSQTAKRQVWRSWKPAERKGRREKIHRVGVLDVVSLGRPAIDR